MRAALEFTEAKAKVNSLPGPATVGRRRYTRPSLPANRATLPDTLTLNGWFTRCHSNRTRQRYRIDDILFLEYIRKCEVTSPIVDIHTQAGVLIGPEGHCSWKLQHLARLHVKASDLSKHELNAASELSLDRWNRKVLLYNDKSTPPQMIDRRASVPSYRPQRTPNFTPVDFNLFVESEACTTHSGDEEAFPTSTLWKSTTTRSLETPMKPSAACDISV
ncbi:unnamed protein product [Mesocestoides corti]|uniref:Uncharacterized protein n=1 Tax=Mesocestoides corti TaxID=53468 RepID=A0A0R3ULI5_MESCO|nr:unnamed protein product [Mesocestoides corti]